jgi:hypothetical protein
MLKKIKFFKSFILIISIIIGLLIVEVSLRILKIEYPIFQTFDVDRGFALRSNSSGWWKREGKAFIKINSQGLRDIEHSKDKEANSFRIAILGDSFAEARSIKLEKTFWYLLKKNLAPCDNKKDKKIEVINFGVTEYGTTQQLITLRNEVWDFNPDLILLAFFSENDVADNSRILSKKKYKPYFNYEDNKLVIDNSFRISKPYLLLKSNLGQMAIKASSYSRVVQVLREVYVKNYFKKEIKKKKNSTIKRTKELYNPVNKEWIEAWNLTETIITIMNNEIKEKMKNFIVVTLSNPNQVHPDITHQKFFKNKYNVSDLFYPDKRIKNLGLKKNFVVLNLAEKMKKEAQEKKIFFHGFQNTVMGEGHWNEKGHAFASKEISKTICKNFKFF